MRPKFIDRGAVIKLKDQITVSKVWSDVTVIPAGERAQFANSGELCGDPNTSAGDTLPVLRKAWLDKFGMADPVTLTDGRANFEKAHEVKGTHGFSCAGRFDIQGVMSAGGVNAGHVLVDGKRTIPYATNAAAPVYERFGQLSKGGLLGPKFATQRSKEVRSLIKSDNLAAVTYLDALG